MQKAVNIEIKASFQSFPEIREINSRCLKGYKPRKKDKDETN